MENDMRIRFPEAARRDTGPPGGPVHYYIDPSQWGTTAVLRKRKEKTL